MLIKKIILLLLSIWCVSVLYSQSIKPNSIVFNNISTEDGLPHNYVNDVIEDHHGFIWIATNDGLCRYDAYENMKLFVSDDLSIKNGLKTNYIMDLCMVSDTLLYIGTRQGGLTIYNINNDTWETYIHDDSNPKSISNDEILSILEDSQGRIWIGTENGLNYFDKKNKTFKRYEYKPHLKGKLNAKAILSITEDNNGWIWIGTWDGGFYLLDIDESYSDIYFRRFDTVNSEEKNSLNVWKIINDNYNNYWLATNFNGLVLMTLPENASDKNYDWEPNYQIYNPETTNHDLKSYQVFDILQDERDNLWLATNNGVSIIPNQSINKKFPNQSVTQPPIDFSTQLYDPTIRTSISNNLNQNLYCDSKGTMWIGSNTGCSSYNFLSNQFEYYKIFDSDFSLADSQNCFVKEDQVMWIASNKLGLVEYNLNTNTKTQVLVSELQGVESVDAIYSKNPNELYISTSDFILKYDLINQESTYIYLDDNNFIDLDKNEITYIMEDNSGNLWVSSNHGLAKIDLTDNNLEYFLNQPDDTTSITDNSINQILQTTDGDIYISTHNGLSKVVERNGKVEFKNYKANSGKNDLKSNRIIAMAQKDSILYLGSESGLLGYNLNQDKFLDYRSGNKKLNINSLQFSNDQELWGSTPNKLFKFDLDSKKIISFDYKDGVGNSNYLFRSVELGEDGKLYFGHFAGFTSIDPAKFKTNTNPSETHITEIKVLSEKGNTQHNLIGKTHLEIEPNPYTIEINFAVLNYNRPEKTKIAYTLEGFDKDWKYLDKNASAVYTNLDHGKYAFKVKATNEVGIWNNEDTVVNLIVQPRLIETRLAKALIFLLGLILIYLAFKIYASRIEKRNQALKKYNENLNKEIKERNKIENELQTTNEELKRSNSELEQFAYIASHDLQEPLRITGSFIDLLGTRYEDVLDDDAFKYIDFAKGGVSRMGLLIKNLLTFSKVGGTVLDFKKYSIKDIVEEKLLDLSRLIKTKNVTIDLGPFPNINCEKNQIGMLFYNLINNAIKFNEDPNPVVNISAQNSFDKDYYAFYVSDNGIGIDYKHQEKIFEIFKRLHDKDAYEGTGIGLALCKKIVMRHGGKLWVESKIGKGTTFHFTIAKDLINSTNQATKSKTSKAFAIN